MCNKLKGKLMSGAWKAIGIVLLLCGSSSAALCGDAEKTSFRGLSLGLTKDQVLAIHLPSMTAKFDDNSTNQLFASKVDISGKEGVCATTLVDDNLIVNKLIIRECFFEVEGLELKEFAQKIADNYDIDTLNGSSGYFSDPMIGNNYVESYTGRTKFLEKITIKKTYIVRGAAKTPWTMVLVVEPGAAGSFN